jgi:hypothetical protein
LRYHKQQSELAGVASCHLLGFTPSKSNVTNQTSHVTRHTSYVTRHFFTVHLFPRIFTLPSEALDVHLQLHTPVVPLPTTPRPASNKKRRSCYRSSFIHRVNVAICFAVIFIIRVKHCSGISLQVCNKFNSLYVFLMIFFSCISAWAILNPAESGRYASTANFLLADTPLDGGSVSVMNEQVTMISCAHFSVADDCYLFVVMTETMALMMTLMTPLTLTLKCRISPMPPMQSAQTCNRHARILFLYDSLLLCAHDLFQLKASSPTSPRSALLRDQHVLACRLRIHRVFAFCFLLFSPFLQWIKFNGGLWWGLLLLQMLAAASAWMREGTALVLPLLAFRNVKLIQSMRFCLPCLAAASLWDPPMVSSYSERSSFGRSAFVKLWLRHAQMFAVFQHVPMFIGTHFYLIVTADGGGSGRSSIDEVLYKPIAEIARQAAVVGLMTSAIWCALDYLWPKLRATEEVAFEPL